MKKILLLMQGLVFSSVVISPILMQVNKHIEANQSIVKSLDIADLRLPSSGAAIEVELPNLGKLINSIHDSNAIYDTGMVLTNKNNQSFNWLNELVDTANLKMLLETDGLNIIKVIAQIWEKRDEGNTYFMINVTYTSSKNPEPQKRTIGRFLWFINQVKDFWTEGMKVEYDVYSK